MNEKQQTALQTLIAWGDKMLKDNPHKILSFAEVIDKAEELLPLEREQIIDAVSKGFDNCEEGKVRWLGEHYYNETYQTDEQ